MNPTDFKAPETGKVIRTPEVRVEGGAFQVLYVATLPEAVYVLHAFQNKDPENRQSYM